MIIMIVDRQFYYTHRLIISIAMSSSILFPTNEYTSSSKSSEQIQKLIIPFFEHVEQTIAYIISKGLPIQMPYVYKNWHQAHKVALITICLKAPTEEVQNQILIAQSAKTMLEERSSLLAPIEIEQIFQMTLQCLNNLHSLANEHMTLVLEKTIKVHPDNRKLIKRLEEVVLDLGKPSQPIISKVTSGRLISILAKYMGRMIKGEMIDILKRILANNEVQAKKVWVVEIFPKLLQNLELQFIELHLQQKIYESVYDENEEIGIMALAVILKNATKFSIEEQSSRIVKLFIDSLTSKNEKISLMASQIMGQCYQKLQNIILKNENNCIKFWKSVIELSQSKNDKILNNLIYNLPGILMLSNAIYKVEPICEIYIQLFYQISSNKILLASYFHQISQLFPNKAVELRQIVYWMLNEILEDEQPIDEAFKIINRIIANLHKAKNIFLIDTANYKENIDEKQKSQSKQDKYFDPILCDYLIKYFNLLNNKKNQTSILIFYNTIKENTQYFSPEFIEQTLLPKLYWCLRAKTAFIDLVIEIIIVLLARDMNHNLINSYASKINVELSKSNKSYQRQCALLFFYYCTFYYSIDLFQQYKLGEKYLYFNNDKSFKIKLLFIEKLQRMIYFFTRQEKIENSIIISRLLKDSDEQIIRAMECRCFIENDDAKQTIIENSKKLKEKQRQKIALLNNRKLNQRRQSKELKKEDILKKRIETNKSKTKMVIKEIPKKKIAPVLAKTTSNLNFRKNS